MAISTALTVALDDLSSRFFLNLPKNELDSFERLFFQLEQAWWFYEDFYREPNQRLHLPKFTFKDFCLCLFEQSPALRPHVPNFELHFSKFKEYLGKVPVCGAILLDETMTSCVLVKGYNTRTWTFPKGKINQGELNIECAVREVLEETGVNVSALVSDRHVLQAVVKGKSTNLYLAPNVPIDTVFSTQTRKEISDIRWFVVDEIGDGDDGNRFWNVTPFIYKLKAWISRHRHLANRFLFDDVTPSMTELDRRCQSEPSSQRQRRKKDKGHRRSKISVFRSDVDTFGCAYSSWPAEEMFAVNARLFGVETSTVSDANELSALMANNGTMTGAVQWRQAMESLNNIPRLPVPLPAPPQESSSCLDSINASAFPTKPACGDANNRAGNALLNFELDDAGIMSHFFQA